MKVIVSFSLIIILLVLVMTSQAQNPIATTTPTPGGLIIAPPTVMFTAMPSPIPTNTPRVSPTPTPIPGDHFFLSRPFAYDPDGIIKDFPARGYAYGSTAANSLQVHHGIDIENPTGTWIRAVGDGVVFYAGTDLSVQFGPRLDFYGNLVVIKHTVTAPDGRDLYSLYGHLSDIDVEPGQEITAGETIGAVGATGVAFGAHLHIEVRIANPYDYYSTYNPELWIMPWRDHGVFAARIVDAQGQPVMGMRVEIIGQGRYFPGWTYSDITVNGDPYLQENIAIGDMPAGEYDIKVGEIRHTRYRGKITILPGETSFYEITLQN